MDRSILLAVAASILISTALMATHETMASQSPAVETFSIDMDAAGNTANSLGARQECREALPGATLLVDITVEGISESTPMLAYHYDIEFPGPTIGVTEREAFKLNANAGSQLFNASDPLPNFEGSWSGSALDIAENPSAHETGSGTLDRLTIEISTDAAPSVYLLEITTAVVIDPDNEAHTPSTIQNARLAIGVSCAGSTPVPPVMLTPTAAPNGGNQTDTPGNGTPTAADGGTDGTPTGAPGATTPAGTTTASPGSPSPRSPGPYETPDVSPSPDGTDDGNGDDNGGDSTPWIVAAVILTALALATGGLFALYRYRRR